MPEVVSTLTVGEVGMVVAVLAFLVGAIRKVFPWIATLVRFLDDITGDPGGKGRHPRPGLLERQDALEADIAEIKAAVKELRPNGGGSVKDHVVRTNATVTAVQQSVDSLRSSYDEHLIRASASELEIRAAVAALQHRVAS